MRLELPTIQCQCARCSLGRLSGLGDLSGTLSEKDAEHVLAKALPGSLSGPLGIGGSMSGSDAAHKIVSILYKKGWVVTDTPGNTPSSAKDDIKSAVLSSLGTAVAGNNQSDLAKAFKGLVAKYSIVKASSVTDGAKGAAGDAGTKGDSGAAGDSGSSGPLISSEDLKKWAPWGLAAVAGVGLLLFLKGK